MAKVHTVKQGEHIAGIAAANGFGSVDAIVKHASNRELMQKRTPDALVPGDRLNVPDIKQPSFSVATCKTYEFTIRRPAVKLRVAFQRARGLPCAARGYRASCESGALASGELDADGLLDIALPVTAQRVDITLEATLDEPEQVYRLFVGHLDPVGEYSGLVARLQNLGYLGHAFDDDEGELRAAIEEFQCDAALPTNGELGEELYARLVEVHGS